MPAGFVELRRAEREGGVGLTWKRGESEVLALSAAVEVELAEANNLTVDGQRHSAPYSQTRELGGALIGEAEIDLPWLSARLTDSWRPFADDGWRVDRRLEILSVRQACGVRLILELVPTLPKRAYGDFRYFAPPALYDLNDLNEDGVEDYLDARSLHYREDRLNLLSILAYNPDAGLGFSLSRADLPEFDPTPERSPGQKAFLQRTDIGSLGFEPKNGEIALIAAYPFAERTRSNALMVRERSPFAAFWPAAEGDVLTGSWNIRVEAAADVHAALWSMWRRKFEELQPSPVALGASSGSNRTP